MATKKVLNEKAVKFPLDQIGYDVLSAYVTDIEEFAKVLKNAVWNQDSFDDFRANFFEVYEKIKNSLYVYRDRLGNIIPTEELNHHKPAPNSWLAIAKAEGRTRLELPRNAYDEKLEEVIEKDKKYDKDSTRLDYYYGDWGIIDRGDWLNNILKAWGIDLELPWYKKLWNWIRGIK